MGGGHRNKNETLALLKNVVDISLLPTKFGDMFDGHNTKLLFNFESNFRGTLKNMQDWVLGEKKSQRIFCQILFL